jgi:archaeosortase C (PEF-CTERM variant)
MELRNLVGWAKGHRNFLVVAALILVVAGTDLIVNRPKGEEVGWFFVPLLAAGFTILALVFWPATKAGPRAPGDTLAHRFLWWATWNGRMIPLFPVFGIAVIVADLTYNAFLATTPELLEHDQAALLAGGMLVAYRFVPERYGRERDFVFLFAFTLSLILVLPLLVLRAFGDINESVDAYSWVALAPQTGAILNAIGIPTTLGPVASSTAPGLTFVTERGLQVTVAITSACSGIYSFAIFSSAFAAFVMTEQKRLTKRVVAFFGLGIFLAYLANILRMVAIVVIGYKYDTPEKGVNNMLIAHSNFGWIIFLGWIALFWLLLFRFMPRELPAETTPAAQVALPKRRGVFCGVCGIVLTPAIPATRCQCGKMYHVECLTAEGRCAICSTPAPVSTYPPVDHPIA